MILKICKLSCREKRIIFSICKELLAALLRSRVRALILDIHALDIHALVHAIHSRLPVSFILAADRAPCSLQHATGHF